MKQLIIIKLGGSVITDKNSEIPQLKKEAISSLCKQIVEIYNTKTQKIILVHGAGSFAHPIAKKHNLKKGAHTAEQILATAEINYSMSNLNNYLAEKLVKSGLPAVGLPPHSFISQEAGVLKNISLDLINDFLKLDMIPILYGDMVLDNKINASVISGDTIVPFLGKALKADQVIYVSDVNGVYKENPKMNPNSYHIKEINNDNFDEVITYLSPNNNSSDVTGEMAGKLNELKKILSGIPIYIIDGNIDNNLKETVFNEGGGTRILLKD